jgi:hypothetical protein
MSTVSQQTIEGEKGATGLLIATYVLAPLGGLIGIFLGFHIFASKLVLSNGTKVAKFKKSHRIAGLVGGIMSIVSFICWKAAMN